MIPPDTLATAPVPTPAHDRAVLLALCVTAFMAALNFFATAPFYPEIADELDTTVPLLGQVATVMILLSAILGLVVGPLADRYGFRRLLTLGVVAIAVTLIGISMSPSMPVLFVFSLTGGLADALVFGLAFAVAGTWFNGQARVRAIGWTSGSLSIAPIVGVPLLTLVGDLAGWRTALAVGGACAGLAALFVWRTLPDISSETSAPFSMRDLVIAWRPVLHDRPILLVYLINFLRGVSWLAFITYLGAFLEDRLGLGTREIGLVYMLSGVGYAVGGFSRRPVLPGTLIQVAGLTSIACSAGVASIVLPERIWLIVLALPVAGFMSSRGGIAISTMLAGMGRAGSGTVMVLNGSVFNFAAAAGALVGGVLISVGGYDLLGWIVPLFGLVAGAIAFWQSRQPAFA